MTTMISPLSPSELREPFDCLHREVQRWVRAQGWAKLRAVQDEAIKAIVGSERDVLISATTAAGKTEAAFLPLLSQAADRQESGVAILYVAPLKALINDQYRRLEELCARLALPLTRWHGDAPTGPKNALFKRPRGVVLITPESIEAMFVRRTSAVEALFGALNAVVIDELHSFLQGPRGLHLWSLLRRIEALNAQRPRRVGLSATLGDLAQAGAWLSATAGNEPKIIAIDGGGSPLKIQVRAYVEPPKASQVDLVSEDNDSALARISAHAFGVLRGRNNLFFAGSRANVELLADQLRTRSEQAKVPNEFFPHHGSLAKELREELETRLKEDRFPTTAVATTTLELGIDIGSVHTVAQLGAPRSLSSLRQRLGRSGRREGTSAIFRNYLRENAVTPDADPLDRLHLPVAMSVAAMRLLRQRFVEPSHPDPAVLSVLVHQLLSLIVERGACSAATLYTALCEAGPFAIVSSSDFAELLRGLGRAEKPLIEQAVDGSLMLAELGEWLTASRDFYANFASDEEWRIVNSGRALGTLPIVNTLVIGSILSFAGRRWRATAIDDRAKVVEVVEHRAGRIPKFDRVSREPIHNRLAQELRAVFVDADVPDYLDQVAVALLAEGRDTFADLDLASSPFIDAGGNCHILTWRGSAANSLLAVLLGSIGFDCETLDVGVTLHGASIDDARDVIAALGECPPIETLGSFVSNLVTEKYDEHLPEALLRRFWVKRNAHLQGEISNLIAELAAGL